MANITGVCDKKRDRSMFEIPVDRGWAWIVLIGASIREFLTGGLIHMVFGVMYLELLEYYSASPATTAWVGSVTILVTCIGSPVSTYLAVRWSVRTLMISTLLLTTGIISSMFLPSTYYLYLTWGLCIGMANCLVYAPPMGLLRKYFDRHLGLAMGLGYTGIGVGQMVGPPLFVYLVGEYGLRGTLLIWAGIQLNMAVCALLMRPTHFYTKWQKNDLATVPIPSIHGQMAGSSTTGATKTARIESLACLSSFILLKNPRFILFNLSLALVYTAWSPVAALMIPAHGDDAGLPRHQVALLSTFMGAGATVGRPLLGYLSDRGFLSVGNFYTLLCVISGLLVAVYPHVGHQVAALGVMGAMYMFCSTPIMTLAAVLLKEVVPSELYTPATGWMAVAVGIPHLFSYPMFVYISEHTGTWNISFYISGCCFLLAELLTFLNHRGHPKPDEQSAPEVYITKL